MKISRHQVEKILGLNEWLPTDQEYLTVDATTMQKMIDMFPDPFGYIKGLHPCSDIAMGVIVRINEWRATNIITIPEDEHLHWAVGQILISKWRGIKQKHHANFFIDHDLVLWHFDMQIKQMWRADESDDKRFFAIM